MNREQIIAAAKEAGALLYGRGPRGSLVANGDALERFYAIAFEAGRQSVDTPVALAEAYRCGEEAGRQAEREDAERYRFLRGYMASERTDLDDEFVYACSTNEPKILDEFIDSSIRARGGMK